MNNSNSAPTDPLKGQVIKSLAWLGGMKYLGQLITWGITIVVIRILNPADYGLMAIANLCINFLALLSELGLGSAIVQAKNIEQHALAKVFGFVILCNVLMLCILFFGAPFIAGYFSTPQVIPILKTLSISFIFLSMYVIPQSLLVRGMDFRKKSIIDLIGSLVSALVTLILALRGYGLWALVWGSISMHVTLAIAYNLLGNNFVLPKFTFGGMGNLLSFGGFMSGGRVLWYLYSRADVVIVGRFLGNIALGTYSVAHQLASMPLQKFLPIINQVAFPAYSCIQSDPDLVRTYFLKAVRLASLFIFPAFGGLLVVAPELLYLLLGDKWGAVILPFQILCIIMPLRSLSTLTSPALDGIGRVDISFANVAIAFLLMPLSFFIGIRYGIIGICLAWLFGYSIVFFIITKRSLNVLGLSLNDYFSNIKGSLIASLVMIAAVSALRFYSSDSLPLAIETIMCVSVGVIVYGSIMYVAYRDLLNELWFLIPLSRR